MPYNEAPSRTKTARDISSNAPSRRPRTSGLFGRSVIPSETSSPSRREIFSVKPNKEIGRLYGLPIRSPERVAIAMGDTQSPPQSGKHTKSWARKENPRCGWTSKMTSSRATLTFPDIPASNLPKRRTPNASPLLREFRCCLGYSNSTATPPSAISTCMKTLASPTRTLSPWPSTRIITW